MQDVLGQMSQLRRPHFLIRAAKAGAEEYTRDQHLKRLFGGRKSHHYSAALSELIELEKGLDQQRRTSAAAYSIVKHVDLLTAMLGEAQLLRATQSS